MDFELVSPFEPTGDQPEAIKSLVKGIEQGEQFQTLLGVTGSGKTFTVANLVKELNRPTLVLSHNKTLAAQLYGEFKQFFPQQCRRVFCKLLRLLSTRSVLACYRYFYRKGYEYQ